MINKSMPQRCAVVYAKHGSKLRLTFLLNWAVGLLIVLFLVILLEDSFGRYAGQEHSSGSNLLENLDANKGKLEIGKFELATVGDEYSLELVSENAVQSKKTPALFLLKNVYMFLQQQNDTDDTDDNGDAEFFYLNTERANYQRKLNRLKITTDFKGRYNDAISIAGSAADIKLDSGFIKIKNPVLTFSKGFMSAKELFIEYPNGPLTLKDSVRLRVKADTEQKSNHPPQYIDISGRKVNFYPEEERFVFSGNSKMTGFNWVMKSDNISFDFKTDEEKQPQQIYGINNAFLKHDDYGFSADYLHYNRLENTVLMKGNGKLHSEDLSLKGERLLYDLDEKKLIISASEKSGKKPSGRVSGKLEDILGKTKEKKK